MTYSKGTSGEKMNEKIICEKCGSEMEYFIDGSTCGTTCKNCGWGCVTTYQAPIKLDSTDYKLCIEPIKKPSIEILRCTASLLGCNFLEAKSKLHDRIFFTNKASVILDIALRLKSDNIAFTITPEFPYEIR